MSATVPTSRIVTSDSPNGAPTGTGGTSAKSVWSGAKAIADAGLRYANGSASVPQFAASRRRPQAAARESASAAAAARAALSGARGWQRARISRLSAARNPRVVPSGISGGRTLSVLVFSRRSWREVGTALHADRLAADRQPRHDQGRSDVSDGTAADLARGGGARRAHVHRARRSWNAARRALDSRRHELSDAARMGHDLHAGVQHDRAARRADADRARGNRLVRPRNGVSRRGRTGGRDYGSPQHT